MPPKAVLPCSYYAYAEVCDDMKTENWLNCHVHAFSYFGGVVRLLIPDNCKTATISNTRYDMVLNRSYQKLAEYYGTAIVPARVRRPQDKSSVEASVRSAETWIIAALRDRKFFRVADSTAYSTGILRSAGNCRSALQSLDDLLHPVPVRRLVHPY